MSIRVRSLDLCPTCAQVGHKSNERTLIDIQELSTLTIGSFSNAYYVNGNFNDAEDLEGSYAVETSVETTVNQVSLYGWDIQLDIPSIK